MIHYGLQFKALIQKYAETAALATLEYREALREKNLALADYNKKQALVVELDKAATRTKEQLAELLDKDPVKAVEDWKQSTGSYPI